MGVSFQSGSVGFIGYVGVVTQVHVDLFPEIRRGSFCGEIDSREGGGSKRDQTDTTLPPRDSSGTGVGTVCFEKRFSGY